MGLTAPDHIRFTFVMEPAKFAIEMQADVQRHEFQAFYTISNFIVSGHLGESIFPEIHIKKKSGNWIHTDSEKETDLSRAVGKSLDEYPDIRNEPESGTPFSAPLDDDDLERD